MEQLVPSYNEDSREEEYTVRFDIQIIITIIIGYALWPKKSIKTEVKYIWRCRDFGNYNPKDVNICLNQKCKKLKYMEY